MKFSLLDILLPRETKFFAYFNDQVEILIEGCGMFRDFIRNIDTLTDEEFKKVVADIKLCEKRGDTAERKIIDELHKTFITPLDREDIHTIAINIDKALDMLNSITQKFEIYRIHAVPPNVMKFAELLCEMSVELKALVRSLETKTDLPAHCEKLHSLENTADHLFHWSVADLFDGRHNPIDIIKFKEVYEYLEGITDIMDYVGKLSRGVMVKLG